MGKRERYASEYDAATLAGMLVDVEGVIDALRELLSAAERRVAVLEGLLKEAQETIQRSYCTPLRADVVARIDAALGDKGGDDDAMHD